MDATFKLIVAGGREFNDYPMLEKYLDNILLNIRHMKTIIIVSGGARGADSLGERYADEHGYVVKPFPADWVTFPKVAGFIRNAEMAKWSDGLCLFWDGISGGSADMLKLAKKHKLRIRIILYEE